MGRVVMDMTTIRMLEGSVLSGKTYSGGVTIIMDFNTRVLGCTFLGNVTLKGTRRVSRAKPTYSNWLRSPIFEGNTVHGTLVVEESWSGVLRGNRVRGDRE